MPGPGRERALPFFPANNTFPRSCPSFSLGLFYFHNVSQTQATGTSPRKGIYFLTFWPLILVFLTQICHQTINSTLLICSTKTTSIFHKKFKFIFFLTISTKKFHCINYVLLFPYMISSEITLKSDAIYWHFFIIIIIYFFFSLKNNHLYN